MLRFLESGFKLGRRALGTNAHSASVHTSHYDHVLGTSLDVRIVARAKAEARRAEAAILAEVDRLEPLLSGWSDTSELAHWQQTFDVDIPMSPELAEVLEMCEQWRERTGGTFSAIMRPGACWTVDRARGTARRLTEHAASLDAIAKGYIVSKAAARARGVEGVSDVLVNIGGDVQHYGDDDVAIGVSDPFNAMDNAPPIAVVRIRNAAMATSGGYRRGKTVDGQRQSHIVDPRTGRAANSIASASVIAPDCAVADVLATSFSVLASEESVALANALGDVGCMLVGADGTITTNATWNARALTSRVN